MPTARSYRQVLEALGLRPAGGNYAQVKAYVNELQLSTGHFLGQSWGRGSKLPGTRQKRLEDVLTTDSRYQSYKLKRRLIAAGLKPEHCEECGWAQRTVDGYLPVELDHINGDSTDNRLVNLRVLCPNCHSLKPTHRGRKNRGKVLARVVE